MRRIFIETLKIGRPVAGLFLVGAVLGGCNLTTAATVACVGVTAYDAINDHPAVDMARVACLSHGAP